MFEVSIGIPAYNEEANIGHLLKSLLGQKLKKVKIREIIVIASGCTDRTADIVEEAIKKDSRIKLLKQVKRLGKTSADNLFFQKAKSKILVLACADTLPKKDCLENLITPFVDPKVGIVAAQMIPLNRKNNFPGYFSHLWWRLWHQVSPNFFRAGELLAFRKVVKRIPKEIGADEVYLTDRILAKGYKAKYVRQAVVYNMGPQTISDIILMRRRHACHHFRFRRFGPKVYYPKTMDNLYVFRFFLKEVNWYSYKEATWAISSVFLEGFCRFLGYCDLRLEKKEPKIWPRSESTKRLLNSKKPKRPLKT